MRFLLRLLVALAVAVFATSAVAQVYKWVDEAGVTNYGNKPPDNARNVQRMDDSNPRVSTVPGTKPEPVPDRALQQRVDQLERELETQRRANTQPQAGAAASAAQSRERCLAERRVDCDDPYRGTLAPDETYPYYPPVVRPQPPPRPPRPSPPVDPVGPSHPMPIPTPR